MRHTTKEVVSSTRSQVSRMFKFLAITMPLCLAFVLSFSLPAFAQQARPTIAATCTPDQTWLFNAPIGGITTWSDSSFLPGPGSSTDAANITVHIQSSTGTVCSYTLGAAIHIKDSTNGTVITISAITPCGNPIGTFDSSTGALTINGILSLQNLPFTQGTVKTACSPLTTEPPTITAHDGTLLNGSRVDASGNATLVGQTSFVDLITVHTQARVIGTFIRQS